MNRPERRMVMRDLETLWYESKDPTETHQALVADYQNLRTDNLRQDRFATWERIYRNEGIIESTTLSAEMARYGVELEQYTRPSHNLIAQVTDNVVSRIVRTKPRSVYSVSGGNWSLRKVAKAQQRWVDSLYESGDFSIVSRKMVLYGCLLGVGCAKVFKKPGLDEVGVCFVHPSDLFVDPLETTYGEPRRLFQRQFMSQDAAIRAFPEKREMLEHSGVMSIGDFQNRQEFTSRSASNHVEVVEAWHLPTAGGDDGRHIIFCESGVLYEEPWTRSDFPVLVYQWKTRPGDSFYGIAIPEEIIGVHLDVNFTLQQIAEGIELSANPVWLVPQESGVSRDELTDASGTIVEYMGGHAPQLVQSAQVPMDLVRYLSEQEARAYRRIGLDSSTPNAPSPGLETGRAVRMDFDARSMAFTNAMQNWELLYRDFGNKCVAAGKQIWEGNKNFSVVVPKDKWTVEDVPWKDVCLDQNKATYTIKVTAGSQLSQHPAGRIDDVNMLIQMGLVVDLSEKRALVGLTDIEHSNSLATAAREAVEAACEDMLDEGVQHMPEPYDHLDICLEVANAYYLRARTQRAPEDRLDKLRRYLDRATELLQQAQKAPMLDAQEGMLPGAPQPGQAPTGGPVDPNSLPPGL